MMVLKTYIYLVLNGAIRLYLLMLFVYILAGYFVTNRKAGWFAFLSELCEPPMAWIRKVTKGTLVIGMFDLSPLVLFFGLEILRWLLYYLFMLV